MQLLLEALTYHRYSDEPTSVMVILLVRVTLVVLAGWLAGRTLLQASAAVAHRVWLLTIVGMLVVPAVWALTPGWRVPLVTLQVSGDSVRSGATAISQSSAWPDVLVAVWIVGTLIALCYLLLGVISARRLFRGSVACEDPLWLELLAAVRHEIGMARNVELRVTERPMSPAVWSFLHVRVLVPAESRYWTLAQRRSVLVHELAHAARHDCVLQILAGLACAVWWFHPLAWWAASRMRAASELAADDFVIRNGGKRVDYAGHLLSIARSLGGARVPAAAHTMFQRAHLERRLRAILDPARPRDALDWRRSVASMLLACGMAIPLATLTPSTVHAVPKPAPMARPNNIDVHLRLRLIMPVAPGQQVPVGLQAAIARYRELEALVPPRPPTVPPPVTFELIPNWEKGKHAERVIPNYVAGTAQVIVVDPQQPPPAAIASYVPVSAPPATAK